MHGRTKHNRGSSRNLLLLTIGLVVLAALGWFLWNQPETLTAEESAPERAGESAPERAQEPARERVLAARVDGVDIIVDAEVTAEDGEEDGEMTAALRLRARRRQQDDLWETARGKVHDQLLAAAAAERGISPEEMLEAELRGRVGEISAQDIDAFYEQNRVQIDAPKEQSVGRIRRYIERQRRRGARKDLFVELEKGGRVEYLIKPFRVALADDGPARGPADAPVTIVEFSDFLCPACQRVRPTVEELLQVYGDKVRVIFRQFPVTAEDSKRVSEASLCAHEQGKFWQMHDGMFDSHPDLGPEKLKAIAAAIPALDQAGFASCLASGKHAAAVAADLETGVAAGVVGAPTFVINGRFLDGSHLLENFARVIDEELTLPGI